MDQKKVAVTLPVLSKMKRQGRAITMLTAYDATFARLLDGEVEILLVGDSLGMVIKGEDNTLGVTVDEMLYHCRAVARGARRSLLVADMPFLSYQVSTSEAVRNAGRMLKEGNAAAVKIEGCFPALVSRLVEVGIPVMGHLGLLPQSIHAVGGYRVQGRSKERAAELLQEARALEAAGVFCLVLEAVPLEVAREITGALSIPTIGIGAGPHCDGQVLVIYDLLGMNEGFQPRFLKCYESLAGRIRGAVRSYAEEVRGGSFPAEEHSFGGSKGPGVGASTEEGAEQVSAEGGVPVYSTPASSAPRHSGGGDACGGDA